MRRHLHQDATQPTAALHRHQKENDETMLLAATPIAHTQQQHRRTWQEVEVIQGEDLQQGQAEDEAKQRAQRRVVQIFTPSSEWKMMGSLEPESSLVPEVRRRV